MKKICLLLLVIVGFISVVGCSNNENKIVVGATPSPHAQILNLDVVKNYVKSCGYELVIKVYQDYVTPNKALNDGGLDANYFQHIPYLEKSKNENGYDIVPCAYIHNEPLNLYGKTKPQSFKDKEIYIINDASNVERAFKLLLENGLIDSFDITNFNALNPVYESSMNITIKCIDAGLLHMKVNDGGYAIIPGNYALNAWDVTKLNEYKIFTESIEFAYPNVIACKTVDKFSEKINILLQSLNQDSVKEYIESTYGATVNYLFEDIRKGE